MRRTIMVAATALALVGAGLALAHPFDTRSVKAVSATFTATTASDVRTTTCTASDGTYSTSRATYTGAATSSEPTLNGPLTIDAESVVNTTTGDGVVSGRLRIGSGSGRTSASFAAVYSDGSIAGLVQGHADDVQLLGNLSASFSATGGFTNGKIGGGTGGGNAVELSRGGCRQTPPPRPDRIHVRGTVTGVSPTSISAAGVTCTVPSNLAAAVGEIHVNDRVDMTCVVSGGTTTLEHVHSHH